MQLLAIAEVRLSPQICVSVFFLEISKIFELLLSGLLVQFSAESALETDTMYSQAFHKENLRFRDFGACFENSRLNSATHAYDVNFMNAFFSCITHSIFSINPLNSFLFINSINCERVSPDSIPISKIYGPDDASITYDDVCLVKISISFLFFTTRSPLLFHG